MNSAETYDPNVWQRLSDATGTVVTPSNIIDVASLVGAKYSIDHLDDWRGIAGAATTFLADLVDGKVARATGTTSQLGEKLDATGDKLKMAYALYRLNRLDLAPKSLLASVAIRNSVNALLTTADQVTSDEQKLHSSKLGKYSIFGEQVGIGLNVIASQMKKDNLAGANHLRFAANVIGYSGLALGVVATAGYAKTLLAKTSHESPANR